MADLGQTFNAQEVNPAGDYQPLPAGIYMVMVKESEVKITANGKGIKLTMEVVSNYGKGRIIGGFINYINTNDQCQEIGQSTLSALSRACGIDSLTDTSELHGRPFKARVDVRSYDKDDGSKGYSNDVKTYLFGDGAEKAVLSEAPTIAQPTQPAAQHQQAAVTSTPAAAQAQAVTAAAAAQAPWDK